MRKIFNTFVVLLVAASIINGTPDSADTATTASAQTEEAVIVEQKLSGEIYGPYDRDKIISERKGPAGIGNVSAAKAGEDDTDAPDWVKYETYEDGKIYAVGYGKSADRYTALRKAEANARNILASKCRLATGSNTVTLKGSARVNTYYTANGGVYVLMVCNQDGVVIG